MKKANYISLVEQTILFGTECFIKIHKEIENVRAKKKEVVNFVIFLGNKKMESLKQKFLKILVGDREKTLQTILSQVSFILPN